MSRNPGRPTTDRMTSPMKISGAVIGLSALIAVLALIAAGAGLLWPGGAGPYSFTTLRGETAEIYGQGLYRYDTLFTGAGNRATDALTLLLSVPLLIVSTLLYRRGSMRGGLLLMGTLVYFLYVYASYALGPVAYNDLFLLYVVLFSASLFALVLAFRSFDVRALQTHFSAHMPRRGLAIFMFVSGLVTLVVWLMAPIAALVLGQPPERLDTYTTLFTHALDLAVIVPTVFLAGVLILRRDPSGYLIAFPLLVLEAFLAPMILAQTVSQLQAGVTFPPGQIAGPIGGFATIAVIAIWFMVAILLNVSDSATSQLTRPGGKRVT